MKLRLLLVLPLLAACQTIGGWADGLGSHMPVIGERCEHWQCMTTEGRAKSDKIKQQKNN